MSLTRREALRGGTATLAAIAAGGATAAAAADRDADLEYIEAHIRKREDLRRGVQDLVREIREDVSGDVIFASYGTLQEVADRLETLPGIESVPCLKYWDAVDRERWLAAKSVPGQLGWSWRDRI